jgi:hypothetical protein
MISLRERTGCFNLQFLGCLIAVAVVLTLFERTIRSHWHIWLTVTIAAVLVLSVWAVLSKRRAQRLDAEYGFSIVHAGIRRSEIRAFREGVVAFSIPVDLDHVPPRVNFTATTIGIPKADVEMWRQRLSEYLKRRLKKYVIV